VNQNWTMADKDITNKKIWSYIDEIRNDTSQSYPVNYRLEGLKAVEVVPSEDATLAEYLFRTGNRYKKRKRIIFNYTYFNWLLISNLKQIY
jgi:hypothetical protein